MPILNVGPSKGPMESGINTHPTLPPPLNQTGSSNNLLMNGEPTEGTSVPTETGVSTPVFDHPSRSSCLTQA